jgi:uncharacterized protein (TIGR02118 family)
MIHQLIFAAPKPGMTVEEFQRYWVEVHAVKYASKIPQIRKYLIDTTIPFDENEPLWNGVAEIWLANAEEELASIQTPEFLQGARLDEPNWAAFWQTVALDTEAHEIVPGPALTADPTWVKVIVLAKRKEGLPLADFRAQSLGKQAELVQKVPGLRRYLQCHTVDGMYGVGEAPLDVAYQLFFDDVQAVKEAMQSPEFAAVEQHLVSIVEPKYIHRLVAKENWIIGPESR